MTRHYCNHRWCLFYFIVQSNPTSICFPHSLWVNSLLTFVSPTRKSIRFISKRKEIPSHYCNHRFCLFYLIVHSNPTIICFQQSLWVNSLLVFVSPNQPILYNKDEQFYYQIKQLCKKLSLLVHNLDLSSIFT